MFPDDIPAEFVGGPEHISPGKMLQIQTEADRSVQYRYMNSGTCVMI